MWVQQCMDIVVCVGAVIRMGTVIHVSAVMLDGTVIRVGIVMCQRRVKAPQHVGTLQGLA
jgi:hypothetical protein